MLLLQNWSQVLSNLSQVTSVTPHAAVRVPTKRRDQIIQADVFCSESFQNSINLFQSSDNNVFSGLPKHFFNEKEKQIFSGFYLTLPKNAGLETYDLLVGNTLPLARLRKTRNKNDLTISLEHHTFVGNKPTNSELFVKGKLNKKKITRVDWKNTRTSLLSTCTYVSFSQRLTDSLAHQSAAYTMQRRRFKTERNLKAELQRNPGILSRIKNVLSYESETYRNENSSGTASQQHHSLKELIGDESISPEEKHRMVIAFAEGYAVNKKKPTTSSGTMRFIYLVSVTALTAATLFFLVLSYAGGKFILNIKLRDNNEVNPEDIDVTLDDVRGAEEAKRELQEVVEFLKNPEKFSTLGGKLPKGVLLIGPPGTGKTLLARAVAGEAGVPFFHAAGPEFDEVLVGQGARRVRDLFRSAKAKAPCVIFIDEIDSVGAKRANSVLHPYASQTINQLLTEMDGFHKNQGVIVIGATNRKSALDKALLRPGRFDVEVHVPVPDFNGRKEIFDLYLGKILCKNVDVDVLARGTVGFTGADIENMVNQAAVKAASDGADFVTMEYLDYAKDKLLMGPERRSMIPDEETNLCTAYHESGHALVAYYTEDSEPLYKITIVPRNETLGHTEYVPAKEVYSTTKAQLLAKLDSLLGGRAAEELIFGPNKVTTGASSDLEIATSIAERMVKDFGMSEKVGLRSHSSTYTDSVVVNEWGQSTSDLIDVEIKRLIQESYERAKKILKEHAEEHKLLAEALLKYETLNAEEVKAILSDKGKTSSNINKARLT